jgi:hypothetical protein
MALSPDKLSNFLPYQLLAHDWRQQPQPLKIAVSDPSLRLNLLALIQHPRHHLEAISVALEEGPPLPMPQAKIAKSPEFLNQLVRCEPHDQSYRHILHPNKFQIPRVIIDVKVTEPACRRIDLMGDEGTRHIETFPPRELRQKIQVDIFIVEKKSSRG